MKRLNFISLFLFLISVCSSGQSSEFDNIRFSVFLIGDAGEHKPHRDAVLELALAQMNKVGEHTLVAFLGDNIYPVGLPVKEDEDRKYMESKLTPQLDIIKESPGLGFIIPGNHDWAKGKRDGSQNIREQEIFTANYIDNKDAFFPKNGCPGPVLKKLDDNRIFIMIDSQWLLSKEEYRPSDGCRYQGEEEVMKAVDSLVVNNLDKKVIFAAHHPVYTYGNHGGIFSFKQHIFPLTDIKNGLFIPLPIIGSIYPLSRKWFGNIQDATNKRYRIYMDRMVSSFEKHPALVHVSGHEHALEHMTKNGVEYIVSGSGSKTEFVKKKGLARYAASENGFARIDYLNNDDVIMSFWVVNETNPSGFKAYEVKLFTND